MSKEIKDKIVPKLRFPEFKGDGEWKEKKLGDIAEIKRGAASQHLNYIDDETTGIRLLRINDFLSNAPVYVEDTADMKRFRVKTNDLLIAGTGATAGITFMVPEKFNNLAYSYNAPRIRVKNENSYFIYPYLKSDSILKQQKKLFVGNAQPFLDTKAIANFKIYIPKSAEQQKIAFCLSSLDDLITAQNQKLEALKEHKKGLMQQLFPAEGVTVPKLRFPEFKDSGEWEEKIVGEIAKVTTGGTPLSTNDKYWNGDIPWMNSGELNLKRVYSVSNKITLLGLKESSTRLIPVHCILIGLAGQGKTRGTAAINYIELCTNQSIAAIQPNNEVFDSEFLYQRMDSMYDELRALSTGEGGRGGLNLQIIKSIKLYLPNLKEQQKIASCLSSLDELITAQTEKIETLKEHKKGLMQGLFPNVNVN